MSLLEVDGLSVSFGARRVVDGVSFHLDRGETLALVGESGSGKSMTALSLLQLLPPGGQAAGRIVLDGQSVIGAPDRDLRRLRGGVAGMVFQEPMTSLNPLARIGRQVAEAVQLHRRWPTATLRARVIELLCQAGFADAEHRLSAFPHQLSGGQRQRVMIAMALANDPTLLIADEPTTALDVTIQAQILKLLAEQKQARGLALLLITHDLAIVRRYADRVCVMKDGRVVEAGRVAEVFARPQHPYTRMLLAAEPKGAPPTLPAARPDGDGGARRARAFRDPPRRAAAHGRARPRGRWRRHRSCTRARRSGWWARAARASPPWAMRMLRPGARPGRDRGSRGATCPCCASGTCGELRARMQIVFQDPYGSLSPRLHGRRDRRRGAGGA